MNTRKAHNHILNLMDEGALDPRSFLESLLHALSESEIQDNLQYIQRVEDWPNSIRIEEIKQ